MFQNDQNSNPLCFACIKGINAHNKGLVHAFLQPNAKVNMGKAYRNDKQQEFELLSKYMKSMV